MTTYAKYGKLLKSPSLDNSSRSILNRQGRKACIDLKWQFNRLIPCLQKEIIVGKESTRMGWCRIMNIVPLLVTRKCCHRISIVVKTRSSTKTILSSQTRRCLNQWIRKGTRHFRTLNIIRHFSISSFHAHCFQPFLSFLIFIHLS